MVEVDLRGLDEIGTPASESQRVLLRGDNSAISVVTSRYMLALQHERGVALEGQAAAMRTACLTGLAQSKMADPASAGDSLVLGAGDLDEAVSGLLTNGIAGSDAAGAYFRYAASKKTFSDLGWYAWWRLLLWIRRKHPPG